MKIAMFTDIHWGAKNNSSVHNQDCMDYIKWFAKHVVDEDAKAIVFMGDWFENRNAINVATLNRSLEGLRHLNSLGLPIYFCVGNHDLFHRENRNEFSTYHYTQFDNVNLVNEKLEVTINDQKLMFYPFLFRKEYPAAAAEIEKYKPDYVFGHFEFKNFVVTGSDRKIEHGPDHTLFKIPKYLFSGHFHKRQVQDNVIYIGNTFPTNYGDAWDDQRGMCILDMDTHDVEFIDWEQCPKYRKVKLSDVLEGKIDFPAKCRVRCLVDTEIGYSDAQALREELVKGLNLREFSLEENYQEKKDAIGADLQDEFDLSSLNDAVIKMIETGMTATSTIEPKKLTEIYATL